jgi:phage tail-like protein
MAGFASIQIGGTGSLSADVDVGGLSTDLVVGTPAPPVLVQNQAMDIGGRKDPYLDFRFRAEIEGLIVAGFSEVSGLQMEMETEDYQEGGTNGFAHKLPKPMKYPNVVLKRGLTDSDALWKWLCSTGQRSATINRKTVRIILLDSEGQEKMSWRCLQAYPVKWTGPEFKSDANTVAFENLDLVHCGIVRAAGPTNSSGPTSSSPGALALKISVNF